MKALVRIIAGVLLTCSLGCTGPRPPPGWPSGEERPINPSQVIKAVK